MTRPSMPRAACLAPKAIDVFDALQVGHRVSEPLIRKAREYCLLCPERKTCLAWAVDYETSGVWAGLTGAQLNRYREQHGIELKTIPIGRAKPSTTPDKTGAAA